jgi:hypothetical protein
MLIPCVHIPRFAVEVERQRRDGTVNVIAEQFTPLRADGVPAPKSHNFGCGHR